MYLIFVCILFFQSLSAHEFVTLKNQSRVRLSLLDDVTRKLQAFKDDPDALYQLAGLSTQGRWRLKRHYREEFIKQQLLDERTRLIRAIRCIVAFSITLDLKTGKHCLVNPRAQTCHEGRPMHDDFVAIAEGVQVRKSLVERFQDAPDRAISFWPEERGYEDKTEFDTMYPGVLYFLDEVPDK